MRRIAIYAFCATLIGTFSACHKDDTTTPVNVITHPSPAVMVLCESGLGSGTSTLTYYDSTSNKLDKDYFKTVNGYDLGSSANDMERYGNKIYITVTGFQGQDKVSAVEVLDANTFKSLARISFGDGTASPFRPRNVAFAGAKAYVSCYDGNVRRIDTATLKIDGTAFTDGAQEELTVSGNSLYVTNSDNFQFTYPNSPHDRVSVIDLSTFTKKTDITVAFNPNRIVTAGNGNVYVGCWGNFSTVAGALVHIDPATNTALTPFATDNPSTMTVDGDAIFAIPQSADSVYTFTDSNTRGTGFIQDLSQFSNPYFYHVSVDSKAHVIYIADAGNFSNPGKMHVFTNTGVLLATFETGGGPQRALFFYK